MKQPLLTIAFALVASVNAVQAETINVADHGIVPGKDVTMAVNRLIESLEGKADVKSFNGLLAKAFSVQGLTIADNTIELSRDYPHVDEGPAVVLQYCDDVTVRNNKFIGFDRQLSVGTSDDCSNITVDRNEGVSNRNVTRE